jgi:hypothetical protein
MLDQKRHGLATKSRDVVVVGEQVQFDSPEQACIINGDVSSRQPFIKSDVSSRHPFLKEAQLVPPRFESENFLGAFAEPAFQECLEKRRQSSKQVSVECGSIRNRPGSKTDEFHGLMVVMNDLTEILLVSNLENCRYTR